MAQIINELATIEVNDKVLQQLEIGEIYQTFQKNYQKLDDLKNFRSEYEKKNRLMRWWHNDKLQDAQLDSAEVQAEFSKTIGQLMMISIIQSKKLSEQQMQLNNQQGKLKAQANGIAEHASELQKQHHVLAEQSQKLEELVREYFELKGLTEDGAEKLIGIAREVKTTKDQMLQEFTSRANDVEAVCAEVQTRIKAHSAQLDEHIRLSDEKTLAGITSVQQDTREALASYESSHRVHLEAAQSALNQSLEKLSQSQHETAIELQTQQAVLESRISDFANKHEQKLAAHQEKLESIDTAVEDLSARSTELGNAIAETKIGLSENIKQQQIHKNEIAREVKATKDQMLQEFTSRANNVEAVCAEVQTRIKAHSAQVDEHIRLSDEKTLAGITSVQQDTREALASYESSHRVHLEAAQSALNQSLEKLSQSQHETAIELQTQQALLESRISDFANKHEQKLAAHQEKLESIDTAVEDLSARSTELGNTIDETKIELSENVKQQQIHQSTIAIFHQEISKNLKRLSYSSLGILILVLGIWAA